jgi:uncharacterized LabA/DUF88 family protein
MANASSARLAVLIDADNAQPAIVEGLLSEIAKYGTAHAKRIYGDWTGTHLKGWKDTLLTHSIQPIQQFGYTRGKNATDSAMIIDAMDLLYTERFDGFCIVSSDSDFTRLAARIRESGLTVYGFGQKKTPEPFVAACDKFIYTEVLLQGGDDDSSGPVKRMSQGELRKDPKLGNMIRNAIDAASDDSGWAGLGAVGQMLSKQSPDFDSRNYGYAKLSDLVAGIGLFETEQRPSGNGKTYYVRRKPKGKR